MRPAYGPTDSPPPVPESVINYYLFLGFSFAPPQALNLCALGASVVPIPPRIRVIPIEERTKGQVKLECFLMVGKQCS